MEKGHLDSLVRHGDLFPLDENQGADGADRTQRRGYGKPVDELFNISKEGEDNGQESL